MKATGTLTATAVVGILSVSACNSAGQGTEAEGEDFPTGTVSITVPYAPGGSNDVVARAIAPCLGEQIGETVIVENKEGGGGAVGTGEVVLAEPDGHTLAIVPTTGSLVLLPLLEDVGYSLDDFTPVSETYVAPSALYVTDDSPFETAEEFFQQAKDEPESISVGMAGAGTIFDFELKYLAQEYGVPIKPVPFDGGAEAQAALLGGNVDALYALADQGRMSAVEAGELRVLATGSPESVDYIPDVSTFAELGYADLTNGGTSFVLVAPAGLNEDVQATLADATQACLADDADMRTAIGENYIPEEPAVGQELETDLQAILADLQAIVES